MCNNQTPGVLWPKACWEFHKWKCYCHMPCLVLWLWWGIYEMDMYVWFSWVTAVLWPSDFMLSNLHCKLWAEIFIDDILWCAKWMSHVRHVMCSGVQNVCLYVLWPMHCYAKCMFVCTMLYALLCKMYVCMYYEICFGVQNVCLYVLWNMLWCAVMILPTL